MGSQCADTDSKVAELPFKLRADWSPKHALHALPHNTSLKSTVFIIVQSESHML